jgi:signal transduction histidine kinase
MREDGPPLPSVDEGVVSLTLQLGVGGPGYTVRDALRNALDDPLLDLLYVRVGSGGWVDELGQPASTPTLDDHLAFTPIERDGSRIAGLIHDPVLLRHPERLRAAAQAASMAIDNERLKAELRAELLEAQASRARIADAGDAELRRLERNLHDGAQQRLVSLALMLRMATRHAAGDAMATGLLADAARELEDALAEMRDLTRRIQPAIVSDVGLEGALESLAERPGVPVDIVVAIPDRLPEALEIGAFYVVAEALTNANKHAGARRASVRAEVVTDVLHLTVCDDGRGGAKATPGSGLAGLADRVATLGGELEIDSPIGGGTMVTARFPVVQTLVEDDRRRMRAHKWIGWENWKAPAELYEQITHDDNWISSRLMMLLAGGNASLTVREREWLLGYLTTAGVAPWVLEATASYDDSDKLADLLRIPGVPMIVRGNVYEALRMCTSDGPLTPDELTHICNGAESLNVPPDVVTELYEIVAGEQAFRDRRYELIVKPVLFDEL